MRYLMFPGLVLMLFASLSSAQSGQQSNKPVPLALLASAKFVYIEPYEGPNAVAIGKGAGIGAESVRDPGIIPEDGRAVADVQKRDQKWGYYQLTIRRSEADLVVFLRKGRAAGAHVGGHAGTGIQLTGEPSSTQKPGVGVLAGADAGSNVNVFWVYSLNRQRKLIPNVAERSGKRSRYAENGSLRRFQGRHNHCCHPPGKEANRSAEEQSVKQATLLLQTL
jgi:hypothetical protein